MTVAGFDSPDSDREKVGSMEQNAELWNSEGKIWNEKRGTLAVGQHL